MPSPHVILQTWKFTRLNSLPYALCYDHLFAFPLATLSPLPDILSTKTYSTESVKVPDCFHDTSYG